MNPGLYKALIPFLIGLSLIGARPTRAEDRSESQDVLRVGTSGDYQPFSMSEGGGAGRPATFSGFDPALARAYALDRGLRLRFVQFRWPDLLEDLAAGRFDLAMSGVTIRPDRSVSARFSVPVAVSGAVVLVQIDSPIELPSELDRPDVRIAVNDGGHLERVARDRFPQAQVIALSPNSAVIEALAQGLVTAAVSDTLEAPHWQRQIPGLRAIGPLSRDRKALLIALGNQALAQDLDNWLLQREADGTLGRLRATHLGQPLGPPQPSAPLEALVAAIDERLALMPGVALAKQQSGVPIEVPAREQQVIKAGVAAVRRAESQSGSRRKPPLPTAALQQLFRAQIEAAKAIQANVLARPTATADARPPPDLDTLLRPTLLRLGDRIAWLAVQLPPNLTSIEIREAMHQGLSNRSLAPDQINAIADALVALSS